MRINEIIEKEYWNLTDKEKIEKIEKYNLLNTKEIINKI